MKTQQVELCRQDDGVKMLTECEREHRIIGCTLAQNEVRTPQNRSKDEKWLLHMYEDAKNK